MGQNEGCIEGDPRIGLLAPIEAMVPLHERMLQDIISFAQGSAIYRGRVREISSLKDLSLLPLTSYQMIEEALLEKGQDRCLLRPPDHVFQTSGSTGRPKQMFYSEGDTTRFAAQLADLCHAIGFREGDVGWNLGGAPPNVSGALMEWTSDVLRLSKLTTLLTRDSDLMPAMHKASRAGRIDVVASAALALYFVARSVNEPEFLRGVVREKLRRDHHLPSLVADLAARIFICTVRPRRLERVLADTRIALTYAEPLTPYHHDLREGLPKARFHDVLGSTENPVLAAQFETDIKGLCLFINAVIPEIADPVEVADAKERGTSVKGIAWTEWKEGMRGELIITRPGDCLPLIRYPTGDMIEVLEPLHSVRTEGGMVTLPLILVLGRSVDLLDFEVQDEMGCFLGNKIYSHHIHQALQRSNNVRWWELYNIKGQPGRLCFLIIPEKEVGDKDRYKKEVLDHLLRECDDPHHTLEIGYELGRLDIIVTDVKAYDVVQREIDHRTREGRSLGQLKPKRIIKVESEEAFLDAIKEKMGS